MTEQNDGSDSYDVSVGPYQFFIDNPVLVGMAAPSFRPIVRTIGSFGRILKRIIAADDADDVIFAQLKLAWWREELERIGDQYHRPDPVLSALAASRNVALGAAAISLVDAHEELLLAPYEETGARMRSVENCGRAASTLLEHALGEQTDGDSNSGRMSALVGWAIGQEEELVRADVSARVAAIKRESKGPKIMRAFDGWGGRIAARKNFAVTMADQLYLLRTGLFGR